MVWRWSPNIIYFISLIQHNEISSTQPCMGYSWTEINQPCNGKQYLLMWCLHNQKGHVIGFAVIVRIIFNFIPIYLSSIVKQAIMLINVYHTRFLPWKQFWAIRVKLLVQVNDGRLWWGSNSRLTVIHRLRRHPPITCHMRHCATQDIFSKQILYFTMELSNNCQYANRSSAMENTDKRSNKVHRNFSNNTTDKRVHT